MVDSTSAIRFDLSKAFEIKLWLAAEKASIYYAVTFFGDRIELISNVGQTTLHRSNIVKIELYHHQLVYPYCNVLITMNNGSHISVKYLILNQHTNPPCS